MDIIKKFKVHLIKFGGIIYLSPFDEPKGGKLSRGGANSSIAFGDIENTLSLPGSLQTFSANQQNPGWWEDRWFLWLKDPNVG